jgi:hypothetical protein
VLDALTVAEVWASVFTGGAMQVLERHTPLSQSRSLMQADPLGLPSSHAPIASIERTTAQA